MNKINIQLFFSGLGVILGLFAFVTFFIFYGNLTAGIWAFFSAVFALGYYHLVWLKKKQNILTWHDADTLDCIMHFSFCISVFSFAVMAWYIFEVVYYKQEIYPISDSTQIKAVWSFMCAKWTLALFFLCRGIKAEFNLR